MSMFNEPFPGQKVLISRPEMNAIQGRKPSYITRVLYMNQA